MSAKAVSAKTMAITSGVLVLSALYIIFIAIHVATKGYPIEHWLPEWDRLLLLFAIVGLERLYTYRYAGSQRYVLGRDIIANIVNLYINSAVVGFILLPILSFVLLKTVGRETLFASPGQLGPFWLQVPILMLVVSFFRYWMHRWQHSNEFLWELHSYHHRVTDLRASNAEVSNPVDFALRNIVIFFILGAVGFDPFAAFFAFAISNIPAVFSHCGADIKSGFLSYFFVTPEVHRWHHAAEVPEGHKYSCNYGVEFIFWDMLFGTYHLPEKNGEVVQPARIGHPSGLPDEGNYARLLLKPLGLWPSSWGAGVENQLPAE